MKTPEKPKVQWRPFGHQFLIGTFWIAGQRPIFDGDVDASGQTMTIETGESEDYVALVSLEFDPEHSRLEVDLLCAADAGYWDEACTITHFAELLMPEGPDE